SADRSTCRSTLSRKGEDAKNSAREPTRQIFRSHSSAPTTTAAGRPFRVISWGPCVRARSMTSLRRAFAVATVQASSRASSSPNVLTSSPWLKPGDSRSVGGTRHFPFGWLTLHRRANAHSSTSRRPQPEGQNVLSGVHIGLGLMPAGLATESRLALTRLGCHMPADATSLRRVRGGDSDYAAPVLAAMPFQRGVELAPGFVDDRPVQTCLLAHVVAGLLHCPFGRCRHVLDAQVFHDHQA